MWVGFAPVTRASFVCLFVYRGGARAGMNVLLCCVVARAFDASVRDSFGARKIVWIPQVLSRGAVSFVWYPTRGRYWGHPGVWTTETQHLSGACVLGRAGFARVCAPSRECISARRSYDMSDYGCGRPGSDPDYPVQLMESGCARSCGAALRCHLGTWLCLTRFGGGCARVGYAFPMSAVNALLECQRVGMCVFCMRGPFSECIPRMHSVNAFRECARRYLHLDQGGDSGTGEWSLMALDFYGATGDAACVCRGAHARALTGGRGETRASECVAVAVVGPMLDRVPRRGCQVPAPRVRGR